MAEAPRPPSAEARGQSDLQTDSLPQILCPRKIKAIVCPKLCCCTVSSEMPESCHHLGKNDFSLINSEVSLYQVQYKNDHVLWSRFSPALIYSRHHQLTKVFVSCGGAIQRMLIPSV